MDFGLKAVDILQKYATQLLIGVPAEPNNPAHQRKNKRLIDIEIRNQLPGPGALASYVYDVVWVTNQGAFEMESWFVPSLKEEDVKQLEHFQSEWVITDVERYPQGQQWRFSVILQRNLANVSWQVLLGVDLNTALAEAQKTTTRLVDFDEYFTCPSGRPSHDCSVFVDLLSVQNTGANTVGHLDMFFVGSGQPFPSGFQPVDLEIGWRGNYVVSSNPFVVMDHASTTEVIHHHHHTGRIIDFEVYVGTSRNGIPEHGWRAVHLTSQ